MSRSFSKAGLSLALPFLFAVQPDIVSFKGAKNEEKPVK